MALCRCKEDHSPPRTPRYTHFVLPIGYPITSSICGSVKCDKNAVVWLDKQEVIEYQSGKRIFIFDSNVTKVKVDDCGLNQIT